MSQGGRGPSLILEEGITHYWHTELTFRGFPGLNEVTQNGQTSLFHFGSDQPAVTLPPMK